MSALPAYLEDFVGREPGSGLSARDGAAESVETLLARARGKARAEGLAEGIASAEAQETARQTDQLQSIREALEDARLSGTDRDDQAATRLAEVAISILRGLAPDLIHHRLETAIRDALSDVRSAAPGDQVQIFVPPGRAGWVAGALASFSDNLSIQEDPLLAPEQARVAWRTGFDQIDDTQLVEATIAAIRAEIGASAANSRHSASENSS
ncbi:MAG: hypothetical protein AAGE80_07745 [Pseudomonadota bacterium]